MRHLSKRDGAQIIVIADAGENEVFAFGRLRGCRGHGAAMFDSPFFRLGRSAVVDRHVVTASVLQMRGHGIAHDAEAEKC